MPKTKMGKTWKKKKGICCDLIVFVLLHLYKIVGDFKSSPP